MLTAEVFTVEIGGCMAAPFTPRTHDPLQTILAAGQSTDRTAHSAYPYNQGDGMSRDVSCLILISFLLIPGCDRAAPESYGFIATLGNDTTSIERITRTPTRITGEAVGRSPVVVRRRWEATLAADGTIRRWTLDTHIPNGVSVTSLHHEATIERDRITLVRQVNDSTTTFAYRLGYPATVPWNAFLYGTYEPLLAAARGLADTTRIGIYFFEGWAEGQLGYARVRVLGGDSVALSSTGLSGAGVAHVDADGRLLAYSGAGTTYKQQVSRVRVVPDLDEIERRFAADEKAKGVRARLSNRDTAQGNVGTANVMVVYGRPLARARQLVGGLIPYGRVWRTGANEATQLHVSQPVRLAGVALDTGAYTLWTLPSERGVQLIINRQTGQWGTGYQSRFDIARVPMQVDTLATHVEAFTIRIDPAADRARLVMEWGSVQWSVPIEAR